MTIRGIDISSVQGNVIDWAAVAKSGVRFAMIKCGNGNNAPDPSFSRAVFGARRAGIVVGPYHVGFPLPPDPAHPGRGPVEQARAHFAASAGVGTLDGELPPALDLEWPAPGTPEWTKYGCSGPQVRTWALAYLAEAERLYGRSPLVYDGFPIYWKEIDGANEPMFAHYPLWWVDYRAGTQPPKPWSTWALHQINGGGGHLPSGAPVDEDTFNGSEEEWQDFLQVDDDVNTIDPGPPVYMAPDWSKE